MPTTRHLAVASSALIATLALALSFVALSTLAGWAGWGTWESYAWAIVVDGLIVVSTLAVYSAAERRAYPWAVFMGASLVSLAGNVTHAVLAPGELPVWLSASIAATPPLAHLVATHLTVRLLHAGRAVVDRHVTEEVVAEVTPEPVEVRKITPTPVVEVVPAPAPVVPEPEPARTPPLDARTRALAALADGATQEKAAEIAGVSVRTIRRWANPKPAEGREAVSA